MPYISKKDQERFQDVLYTLETVGINNAGQLNFLLTAVAIEFAKQVSINRTLVDFEVHRDLRYEHINAIIGAFDSAKEEFRRRVMNPYETQKAFDAETNGADPYTKLFELLK